MKMSMTKRIFALLLTVAMLVSVLCACNKPQEPDQTSATTTPDATTPAETLPPDPPTTPPQKITSVNITCGESTIEHFAATELKWYFAKKGVALSDDGFGIAVKMDTRYAKKDGYRIIADENGATLIGNNERGVAYALYSFLEKFLGVHFYATDTVVVDEGDVMIGGGLLDAFEPAFDIPRDPWSPIDKLPEKDGGSRTDSVVTKTLNLNTITGSGTVQPCLTNPDSLPKAVQIVNNYLRVISEIDVLSFSPATEADLYCTCENCARVCEEEGSPAGLYVRFLNALTKEIAKEYPTLEYELVVRAYLKKAPTVTKLADNITVRFNTDKCHISHSVTDTNCPDAVAFAESMRSWGAFCDNINIDYALTATKEYMPVFANLGSLQKDMNFFAECGVKSIRFTGNIACPSGEFGELRVYLLSKLIQDPTISEEEYYTHMDAFLAAFYGEGWTYIRKFIDKIIELSADGHQTADGSHFDAITEQEYLANEESFDEWWNRAEELAGDRLAFVKHGRYQWRYIKLCLHPDKDAALALIEENALSFNERVAWRNSQWNVDTEQTDFALPPTEWVYKS